MKCLSVKQPFCGAILAGRKKVEYRAWTTAYRGPLVIHASLRPDDEPAYEDLPAEYLRRGVLLGVCRLVDCQEVDDAVDGTVYDWHLAEPRLFKSPIPFKGRLGLYDVDDALLAAQIGAAA